MNDSTLLTWIASIGIPVSAVLAAWVTAILVRRSNREANDVNAFKAVTDQLFELNEKLTERVEKLEVKLAERDAIIKSQDQAISVLEDELSEQRRVNGALNRFVKKLLAQWPQGTIMPPVPDEPLQ